MKYKEWAKEWLEYYVKPTVKTKTHLNYSTVIRVHIMPALGEYELEELTVPVLQSFVVELCRSGNAQTGKGLAPSTANLVISVLQRSLKVACEAGMCEKQYADRIKRPRQMQTNVECFSLPEQRLLEEYVLKDPKSKRIGILICLYTGLRIGELMALRWEDIDFSKGTLSVNATCRDTFKGGHSGKILDTPKTASSRRELPIPRQIIPYLRACKKANKSEFVIYSPKGVVTIRSYQKTFARVQKKLKINYKSFHALRHTFATRALECGMDVKTLSEILGHKNPNITLNRYAHSMLEHKRAMMNKLGKLFG